MTTIEVIELRTILDSRGNPTVEADIHTQGGFGRSAAPSGASTGSLEAKVRPPKEAVEYAIQNVIPALIGLDSTDQQGFDEQLRDIDGTANFAEIGANIAVALSLANAKAASSSMGLPLFRYLGGAFVNEMPLPLGNVIGGGAHAANCDRDPGIPCCTRGCSGYRRSGPRECCRSPACEGTLAKRGEILRQG